MQFPSIRKLNEEEKCKLAPSNIHGIGVFAIKNVHRGERLYCQEEKKLWYNIPYTQFDNILPEVRELIEQRYPNVKKGSSFLSPNSDARLISFMNHSDTPNYDTYTDTALHEIIKWEEILEDYKIL